ncbi:MAG TPA: DUF3341 domain-containing protein [Acidobacteria bacterium]|nr:DUF3341 domain-containing protein [Acidobacteriota bacterium]
MSAVVMEDRVEERGTVWGLLAEFTDAAGLIEAAEKVRDAGYTRWDTFAPFAVHGLDTAMGIRKTVLPKIVLGAGAVGCVSGFLLQWWTNAVDYPFLISGKPLFGWPAAVPIAFELTILFAAFGALFGMLGLNGLPRLHHPLFTSERFRRVTTDRFFIAIERDDPRFDPEETRRFLEGLGAVAVEEVRD